MKKISMLAVLSMIFLLAFQLPAATESYTYNFDVPQLKTENGVTELIYENSRNFGKEGNPYLPYFAADILLPQNQEIANVRITSIEYYPTLDNIKIKPASKQIPLSKEIDPNYQVIPNEKIYNSSEPFPKNVIENSSTHFLSGHSIGSFTICPVNYIPADNQIKFIKKITIEIETETTNRALNSEKFLRDSKQVENRIVKIVDNPEILDTYSYSEPKRDEEYDILLITDSSLLSAFNDYVEYKESTGFIVKTISTNTIYLQYSGQDEQEKIRNCIIDYYSNYGVSSVILGGDSAPNNSSNDIIPHRGFFADPGDGYADNDIPSDMYYACLDGSWNDDGDNNWGESNEADLYAEVAIGRICADNATEIQHHTNKLYMYQNEPVVEDIEKALMLGEYLWPGTYGGTYKDEVAYGSSNHGYTTEGVSDNFTVYTLYEINSSWNKYDVFNQFNNIGLNLRNHLGHSDVGYNMLMYNSDLTTSNFTNDGVTRGFVIGYSQGCYNGSFDNRSTGGSYGSDCFAEEITTIETADVASIGNSRYGWGEQGSTNGASQYFDREFYDAIFGENITLIGNANGDSKEDNVSFIEQDQVIRWCAYELILFGDPTMDIWTAQPTEMNVSYPVSVSIGTSQITFQVDTPGARVAVMQDGELIGRSVNIIGTTVVNLFSAIDTAQPLTVSVIGHNKIRHEGTIVVVSDQPYVIFNAYEINGVAEYGEDITLDVTLENVGNQNAYNVLATLSTEDDFVTITDNSADYGTISAESTSTQNDAFAVSIANNISDQHIVNFDLEVSGDAKDIWNSGFSITVNAPNLSIGNMTIDDSSGDNDGVLDPGESAVLTISTSNFGHAASPLATAMLICESPYITVDNEVYNLAEIAAGNTENAIYDIEVSSDAPVGETVSFYFSVGAGEYSEQETFVRSIGLIFEDFETGYFNSYPWTFSGNADWIISDECYEGVYGAQSGDIGAWGETSLIVELSVTAAGELSFWKRVSCEDDANDDYDYFHFLLDGTELGRWDGEVAWSEETYSISAGTHTFEWRYYKDGYVDSGSDCAWIDYIIFPPIGPPPVANIIVDVDELILYADSGASTYDQFVISNFGNGDLNFSISSSISSNISFSDVSENEEKQPKVINHNSYIEKKKKIINGLEIKPAEFTTMINPAYASDLRATNVAITCDGGSYQYEVSWEIEDPFGNVVASGGAPFDETASLDNGIYTVYAHDSYGDGWNGNYLTVTDTDGTEYLNWTLDWGSEETATFEVDAENTWISVNPYSGTVAPEDNQEVVVICSAAELVDGTYEGALNISSNDPDTPQITIPVTFIVGSEPVVYGDVDGNGEVQAFDAAMVLQYSAEMIEFDGEQLIAADVDGNGEVQAFDAALILQYSAGIITEFPVEQGKLAIQNQIEAEIFISKVDNILHISTSELSQKDNVIAFQFTLEFDGKFSSYEFTPITKDGQIAVNSEKEGILQIAYMNVNPIVGSNQIISIEFSEPISDYEISDFLLNSTKIDEINYPDDKPNFTKLYSNYPNPFSNSTTISFSLATNLHENARIEIFNIKGQKVKEYSIFNNQSSISWNAENQANGIYFYKLTAGNYTSTKKMILMK